MTVEIGKVDQHGKTHCIGVISKSLNKRNYFNGNVSSFVCDLLYISVVRLKNETTAQSHCAKEYKCNNQNAHFGNDGVGT
jgi:hypothetical protein